MRTKKNGKIRILFTIPNFDTAGSGKHMVDLIGKLDPNEFEPSICCEHEKGLYFKHVKELGYPIFIRKLAPTRQKYPSGLQSVIRNARFFKKGKFDLIHSFHWQSDWFEPLAAKLAGIPWIYTKKSMVWNKHWTIRNFLAKWIFTLNPEMHAIYPIAERKSKCVGLGPDVNEILHRIQGLSKQKLREGLGLDDKKVILSIANLVPIKKIDVLVRAFAKLKANTHCHLLIVGDKDTIYGRDIKLLVQQLQLQSQVTFSGKVVDVEKYIQMADLYVQPSLSEASGVACMEACAAGIPAIGSDVAGLRYVIGNKELLFQPDSESQLLEKMEFMLAKSQEELSEIGKELQNRMFELFHLPIVAKEHQVVYEKLSQR